MFLDNLFKRRAGFMEWDKFMRKEEFMETYKWQQETRMASLKNTLAAGE